MTHIVQAMTSEDREATILSIDGIGACDLVSRNAMFRGVADMVDGDKLVPFMRLFYGSPSTFLWRMMKARCITCGKEKAGSKAIH